MRILRILALLLLIPVAILAEPRTVRILHVNDFHGFAVPPGGSNAAAPGGAARLTEQINRMRAGKSSLLLAAGDMIQGDSWATFSSGESVIELMNLMGFDAMVTGNHEYDFGIGILGQRIKQASFPVLAANVTGMDALKPYTVVMRDGVRIGIIGLVTSDTPETSHPDNTKGMRFSKPLDRAGELIHELRGKTDLIVLLTHLGHSEDRVLATQLSERFPTASDGSSSSGGVLIIGGHSHTRVEQPVRIGDNYVAQAWEHGKTLGVIDITIDNGRITGCSGRLEEVGPALGNGDANAAALVRKYEEKTDAAMKRVVGTAKVDLVQTDIRHRETNLGSLIADIIRDTAGTQAAIINGGSIRTGIRQGPITMRDIYSVLPFNNYIVAVRINGRQLMETLEHGVSGIERDEGRFPQVSGLKFTFDPARPAGKRVSTVTVSGAPLDEKQEYTVATLDFMAAGGDGYQAFGEAIRSGGDFSETGGALHSSRLVYSDPGRWMRDIVADYLGKAGSVSPATGGRITELR